MNLVPVEQHVDRLVAFQGAARDERRSRADPHQVDRRPASYDTYFSRVQLIQVAPDGTLRGASDPRGDGGIALPA